ncbi:MAG: TylF/MycF/NovP-related O-methyltransferase [Pirellulales bacterium]
MFLRNKKFQGWIGGSFLEWLGIDIVSRMEMATLSTHKDWEKLKVLRRARRERRSLVTNQEMFILHSLACGMREVPGDFAEVGLFQGSTAKVICEAKGDKTFHLCDTFEGLPEPHESEKMVEKKGRFACSLESIQKYLGSYPNLRFHKGFCPDSIRGVLDDTQFCFVHLDVDLYESTKQCLEYFWPRLIPGGVVISHDYSILEGVRNAFAEFSADKREKVIEMPTTQCMMIKTS